MIFDLEDLPYEEKIDNESILKIISIGQAQSSVLAAQVVLYKSLSLFKTTAIICMAELHRRRNLGEDFDYENFIDEEINKLPKVQPLDINTIKGMLNIKQLASLIGK